MKFTDIFIRRPIFSVCISLMLLLLGFNALKDMQVRQYPEMTNTVITVTTGYYGADANLIEGFITQPLEQAIAQADNIDYMKSSSELSKSTITVQMKLNTNPNDALAGILAKVNSVRSQLPKEAEDPTVDISTGSPTSIMYIAFSSDVLNSSQITDYLERVIKPQLFTISGVAKANLYGGIPYAIRIWLDPKRMAAFNLNAEEVNQVLQANNYQSAIGQTNSYFTLMNGTADTQASSVSNLKDLIIRNTKGSVIRLGDIAKVNLNKSHDVYRAIVGGKEGVVIAIDVTPNANPIIVAKAVRKLMPDLQRNLPSTIKMKIQYDSSQAINESINEVIQTIIEAAIIVIVVISVFLGSLRAVIIPVVTIPLSLIGVILLMSIFSFSINLMTLLAMILAIGLVVDDAIVVVENVHRHIKMGKSPFKAAINGTREIAMPVITMTITLAAVYSPIALMGGITGSLFKEFALTLAGAVFISGIVALTLSPMMCSKMLKVQTSPNLFEQNIERCLAWLSQKYDRVLCNVLNKRGVILVFAALVMVSLPLMFKQIPTELAPKEDNGVVIMVAKAPSNVNLDYIQANMSLVEKIISNQEGTLEPLTMVGVPSSNQAFGISPLLPWSQRDKSQKQINKLLSKQVKEIPGVAVTTFQLPELPGAGGGLPIQLVITSTASFENLFAIGSSVLEKMKHSPLFVYSDIDLKYDSATLRLRIKKDLAGAYGVTMKDIGSTLSTFMSDGYVNRVNLTGRSYEVIPQVIRKLRENPEALANYYVKAADGRFIPLSSLIDAKVVTAPKSLPHYNQLNSISISAVNAPGTSMGDAVKYIENLANTELPKGYSHSYLGEARQYINEGSALYLTFLLAIAIIFLVLASQFESIRDPLIILISVPLAISGALMALDWAHLAGLASLNIYSQVGMITLVGLITKHGILMCEVAKEVQITQGLSRIEAIKYAAAVRLRPILMTTAAMIAGLIPLLNAVGAGAAARFNIGLVIVAGLSIGTLFTLFVLPVIYSYIAQQHEALLKVDD
ncbi:multidrug efflux RND transporter permease subunit [Parashewanella curva]|uniref:Multidrug efflux RND transporter permease subunit n=1 Tax=Parashewanella curva TaxID=2338552 RepID=A0A3L8PRQ0_9GAMM|nr:multidrug efflux RND transporter permease subunit [Parashewanella curva]RLV58080.1 multidrug efflux RND transporter permease subunit [Parashewanella curva]